MGIFSTRKKKAATTANVEAGAMEAARGVGVDDDEDTRNSCRLRPRDMHIGLEAPTPDTIDRSTSTESQQLPTHRQRPPNAFSLIGEPSRHCYYNSVRLLVALFCWLKFLATSSVVALMALFAGGIVYKLADQIETNGLINSKVSLSNRHYFYVDY